MAKDHPWNLGTPMEFFAECSEALPGIRTPYIFVGTAGSLFVGHTEDAMLCSINILLEGEAKFWCCVAAEHFDAVVNVMKVVLFVVN